MGVRQRADGQGALRGADARGDVMGRIHRDGEGGGHVFPVDGGHERELEGVRRPGESGAQTRPLAWVTMKLMASVVANSAAMMRSPRFHDRGRP